MGKRIIEAAAGCHTGKARRSNEDNIYFGGRILEKEHDGLSQVLKKDFIMEETFCLGIFEGIGNEEGGRKASYRAARAMRDIFTEKKGMPIWMRHSDRLYEKELERLHRTGFSADSDSRKESTVSRICRAMNEDVCAEAQKIDEYEGSTAAFLIFAGDKICSCNLGDSMVFRLREGILSKLSVDDAALMPKGFTGRPPLRQYLGIPSDELRLAPHLFCDRWRSGDQYLLCGDGLTDAVCLKEIQFILEEEQDIKEAVQRLIDLALGRGGGDTITAILCAEKKTA